MRGVYSHGVNRFPLFVKNIMQGFVIPNAEPSLVSKSGGVEQWNGNLGPGPLNAIFCNRKGNEACGRAYNRDACTGKYKPLDAGRGLWMGGSPKKDLFLMVLD